MSSCFISDIWCVMASTSFCRTPFEGEKCGDPNELLEKYTGVLKVSCEVSSEYRNVGLKHCYNSFITNLERSSKRLISVTRVFPVRVYFKRRNGFGYRAGPRLEWSGFEPWTGSRLFYSHNTSPPRAPANLLLGQPCNGLSSHPAGGVEIFPVMGPLKPG